jgi:hypothetical protein
MKRSLVLWALVVGCSDDGSANVVTTTGATTGDSTSAAGTEGGSAGTDPSSTTTSGTTTDGTTVGSTAPPLTTSASAGSTGDNPDAPDVIYVNFDGGDFSAGMDDATADQASVLISDTTVDPYGGTDQAQILATIAADYAPFDVLVTDERPAMGPYAMVVITPTDVVGVPGVAGVAPLDCGDAVRNNVAFVNTTVATDALMIGSVASSRLGSTFGIENGTDSSDLSWGSLWGAGEDPSWVDSCIDVEFSPECADEHAVYCPDGQQNGFAELTDLFGPA